MLAIQWHSESDVTNKARGGLSLSVTKPRCTDELVRYSERMRKLTALLLAVTLIVAPLSSMVATALGFSGEHVHYDHTWHTAAEWMQAKVDSHDHHAAVHHDEHDQDDQSADHQTDTHHNDDAANGPIKHSHPDQVHAAPFLTVGAPYLLTPDIEITAALPPASFPVQQHPYPPFRPPQAVLSA